MPSTYKLDKPPINTPQIYETENIDLNDKIVTAHYHLPGVGWDIYVLEYDQETNEIFCWAELIPGCGEFGYQNLSHLEEIEVDIPIVKNEKIVGKLTSRMEFDNRWQNKKLSEIIESRNK